jgi:putative ABC transport system permease protein
LEKFEKSVCKLAADYNKGFNEEEIYHLQTLRSIHLHSDMFGEFEPNSDIKRIYILGTIVFLILSIACINYINLSFSNNNRRLTEIGMRHIMGASRWQLILLYLSDASLITGLSVIISLLIIKDQIGWFSNLVGIPPLSHHSVVNLIPEFILLFLLIIIITGFFSGWRSSRIKPMDTLKKSASHHMRNFGTQGILVLLQFAISIVLITSALFVYKQIRFIQAKNLGFSKDQLLIIPLDDNKIKSKILLFKQELLSNPNILSASAISDLPGEMLWVTSIDYEGSNPRNPETMAYLEVDKDFIKTFGIKMKEGAELGDTSYFTPGTPYLINEAAVKRLGWKNPVGKKFSLYSVKGGFISGIINDFHFKPIYNKIEPLFLYLKEGNSKYLAIKLITKDISGSIDYIRKIWSKSVPDSPFDFFFYDSYYNQLYKKESQFSKIIFVFSAVAILIACMGLFSLAVYYAEKRIKEIGIRKVNGAKIIEVMSMLNSQFLKWVFIAFLIAIPITWYSMYKWLQNFAYKTELSWWIFGLAGIITLGIALLTVSWQSWKAATRNPVKALRYE